jgi:hypothetical protein
MSPKATRNDDIEAEVTSAEFGNPVTEGEIRQRAYEIYLERGEQPGRDLDDWLDAERELRRAGIRGEQAA